MLECEYQLYYPEKTFPCKSIIIPDIEDFVCLYVKPLKNKDVLKGSVIFAELNDIKVGLEEEEYGTIDCKVIKFKPEDEIAREGLEAVVCKPTKIDEFGFAYLLEGAFKDKSSLSKTC